LLDEGWVDNSVRYGEVRRGRCRMQDVECGMWDVGCGMGCGMWDVGCGMWDVGCGMWDVGRETWDVRGGDSGLIEKGER
jgi:hypothetical protein